LAFSAYDPFNNQPLTFSYTTSGGPSAVTVAMGPTQQATCNPPNFCLYNAVYQEAGTHSIAWAGTDTTGAFRPDIVKIMVFSDQRLFPLGAVMVFGRIPSVTNVHVTPPDFGPMNGTQVASFTLATYQSQAVAVTVSFLNQTSLSTLRTISIPSQAPGNINVTWDGRADDGSLVAPGSYTVTVTAVDSLGNVGKGQILTRVEY
jgi:flagellar hook assembly protein FlgD